MVIDGFSMERPCRFDSRAPFDPEAFRTALEASEVPLAVIEPLLADSEPFQAASEPFKEDPGHFQEVLGLPGSSVRPPETIAK